MLFRLLDPNVSCYYLPCILSPCEGLYKAVATSEFDVGVLTSAMKTASRCLNDVGSQSQQQAILYEVVRSIESRVSAGQRVV